MTPQLSPNMNPNMNPAMNPETGTQYILPLRQATDLAQVGGKACHLGRLEALGMPGAAGFVVPDVQFQAHLQHAGVLPLINELEAGIATWSAPQVRAASVQLQEAIRHTSLDPGLAGAVAAATQNWLPQPLAVRSSAVGEDAASASFAGQLDTFLQRTTLEQVLVALRDVWASLYSEHCLQYARHKNIFLRHLGVVVQQQVQAEYAGVLFSRDPSSANSPSMLLEYCRGLGERLVAGEINPGRISIARRDLSLRIEEEAEEGSLSAANQQQLQKLAGLALQLEQHFAAPQDIEWALDAAGNIFLLQARPITVFAPGPVSEEQPVLAAETGNSHWSNANIAENFPHPVTPFLYSIVKRGYSAYFRELGNGFGLSQRRMNAMENAFTHVVGVHGGRLYYNLSNIHSLLYLAPGGKWLAKFFNQFTGAESFPGAQSAPLPYLQNCLINLRVLLKTVWRYASVESRVRRFEARVTAFAERCHPRRLDKKNGSELAQDLRDFLDIRLKRWNDAALADTAAMVCYGVLKYSLGRAFGGEQNSLHNDLLKGLPQLISSMPVNKLWDLAMQVQQNPQLRSLFLQHSAEELMAQTRHSEQPQAVQFWQDFNHYLETWGFRSSQELTLIEKTPYEDPLPTLRVLQMYVREGGRGPHQISLDQAQQRLLATAEVARKLSPLMYWLPLFSRASRFRILLRATQGAIALRERARFKQALLYTRLRHIALALGQHLQARGILRQVDDIFFLTVDEVDALMAGGSLYPESVQACAQARRAQYQSVQDWVLPDAFTLAAGAHWQPNQDGLSPTVPQNAQDGQDGQDGLVLRGTSACGGKIAGRAVVALDVQDAAGIQAGDILVTRQTDPGWASVFFLIKGLVIERGGMLSHGAIIAREYGIPAVVGVPQATRKIAQGQSIVVDGDAGEVRLG